MISLVLPNIMGLTLGGLCVSAAEVMRRQKVNLNLLVNMNPDRFLLPVVGVCVGHGEKN